MMLTLLFGVALGLAIGLVAATVYWLKGIGDSIGRHF